MALVGYIHEKKKPELRLRMLVNSSTSKTNKQPLLAEGLM